MNQFIWNTISASLVLWTFLTAGIQADELSNAERSQMLDTWKRVEKEERFPMRVRVWSLFRALNSLGSVSDEQFLQIMSKTNLTFDEKSREAFAVQISNSAMKQPGEWQLKTLTVFGNTTRVDSPDMVRVIDTLEDVARDRDNRQVNLRPAGSSRLTYLKLYDLRHVPPPGIAKNGALKSRTDSNLEVTLFSTLQRRMYTYHIDRQTMHATKWFLKDENGRLTNYGLQSLPIPLEVDMFLPRVRLNAQFAAGQLVIAEVLVIDEVNVPFAPLDPHEVGIVGGLAGDTIVDERNGPNSNITFGARKDFADARKVYQEVLDEENQEMADNAKKRNPAAQGERGFYLIIVNVLFAIVIGVYALFRSK